MSDRAIDYTLQAEFRSEKKKTNANKPHRPKWGWMLEKMKMENEFDLWKKAWSCDQLDAALLPSKDCNP